MRTEKVTCNHPLKLQRKVQSPKYIRVTRNGDRYGSKEGLSSFNLSDTNKIAMLDDGHGHGCVNMIPGTD